VRMLNTATKESSSLTHLLTLPQRSRQAPTDHGCRRWVVWWAEDMADRMVRVDPVTGKVEEFKIPFDGVATRAA